MSEGFSSEKFVLFKSYSDVMEAEIVRTKLLSLGIAAVVHDYNIISMNWFLANAVGGVKILVPASKLELAKELIGSEQEKEALK